MKRGAPAAVKEEKPAASKRSAPAQPEALDETSIDKLSARRQNALLYDLYRRLHAVDPAGAAAALSTEASGVSEQQKLNHKLAGKWVVKKEGRRVGVAQFSVAAGDKITLDSLEINEVHAGSVSCEDHFTRLQFNTDSRVCGNLVKIWFSVKVTQLPPREEGGVGAMEIFADFEVECGDNGYDPYDAPEPYSCCDLLLFRID